MKIKKLLLTILLALVAILLLQAQVKAEELEFNAYILTQRGVISEGEVTEEDIRYAGIMGNSTEGISVDTTNKKITINNFTAEELYLYDETYELLVEGENFVKRVWDKASMIIKAKGNGKITTNSMISNGIVGISYNGENKTILLGNSIDDSADQIYIYLEEDSLDSSGKILDNVAQRICEVIPYVSGYGLQMSVPNNTVIPASIFAKLKSCNDTFLCIMGEGWYQFVFNSSNIENTNVDFKIGVEFSSSPIGNMTVLDEDNTVEYIKFKNNTTSPGKVEISMAMGGEEENEPDPLCQMVIESFNENTKSYEYYGSLDDPYKSLSILGKGAILYPQGGYAIYHSSYEAPEDFEVVEIEVNSLVWTEEDINKVLVAIEETKNNTTDKELYLHVPSGSKVPAKIFEACNGIDIIIMSEDGIRARFFGESCKAIDYIAGGTVSNKVINGMVNVGEGNIAYISLKHEGELPSRCYITYWGNSSSAAPVNAKLYYFNKEAQKYELCGTGEMDLAYDYCSFEIDHCSSYVMSEESLPEEFVIASTTGENKEESKKEEVKEDTTKAPGTIPYAGGTTIIAITMLLITAIGIIAFIKNRKLKGI